MNINNYNLCKAVILLESEVNSLKNRIGTNSIFIENGSISTDAFALKHHHYTKIECDEKFALKSDLSGGQPGGSSGVGSVPPGGSIDLSNYVTNDNLTDTLTDYALKTELPDISTLVTKDELNEKIPENQDLSNYLEKQSLEWDVNDLRAILRFNAMLKDKLTHLFIQDNLYTTIKDRGWFISAYEDKLRFRINNVNWSSNVIIEMTENYISFKDDKLITENEANEKYIINDYKDITFMNGSINLNNLKSIAYGIVEESKEIFVVINSNGKVAWSEDGKTFTTGTINNHNWTCICYGRGRDDENKERNMFVILSNVGKTAWSTDGKTFKYSSIKTYNWETICYGNNAFVMGSSDGNCAWSTDGKTFTYGIISTGHWYKLYYGDGMFTASSIGAYAYSTDGSSFTSGLFGSLTLHAMCYGGGMFVAVSMDGRCVWSTDGTKFTIGTIPSGSWYDICYGSGMFVAVSMDGKCAYSTDGKTFKAATIANAQWYKICYGGGKFVAVSMDGKCTYLEYRTITAKSFALKDDIYTKVESDERYVLKQNQQSMTITHLAPIDEKCLIDDFIIGTPVYMTGNVYTKDWKNKIWNKSSINDSIDCISSVKTNGTWKEYLGICTHVLSTVSHNYNEIKFATHGDYLVKVPDSNDFNVGDTIYIDFEENNPKIKILTEDMPLNTKIQRTTIGIITSILNKTIVSVFKV